MNRADAETAVVGACLVDAQAFWKVADLIGEDDFRSDDMRSLWSAISRLQREGKPADAVTIAESEPALQKLAMQTANATFTTANVRAYAEWVIADATQRRVAQAGQRIAKLTGADALPEAQRILAACQPKSATAVRSLRDFAKDAAALMQERFDSQEVLTGVPTPLDWLDEQTAGWQRGDLIVLAARPSVGKTAFAIHAAVHAAERGHPVFFASLEQGGVQIAERMLANISSVSLYNIMRPKLVREEEWPRLTRGGQIVAKLPIKIDETGALTAEAIGARARQVNSDTRLGLIVIDYLTMISPPRAEKTVDAIQLVTRSLKALAKELSVPIILLSQLNREGEEKPVLKNLRDSGAIEQDADVVIFLHRPSADQRDFIQLLVAKQRNGPIGELNLRADMDHMRFVPTHDKPPVMKAASRGYGIAA